jgi:hypothetical protein
MNETKPKISIDEYKKGLQKILDDNEYSQWEKNRLPKLVRCYGLFSRGGPIYVPNDLLRRATSRAFREITHKVSSIIVEFVSSMDCEVQVKRRIGNYVCHRLKLLYPLTIGKKYVRPSTIVPATPTKTDAAVEGSEGSDSA